MILEKKKNDTGFIGQSEMVYHAVGEYNLRLFIQFHWWHLEEGIETKGFNRTYN